MKQITHEQNNVPEYICNNTGCNNKTVFNDNGTMITLIGWIKNFDNQGRPLNADPNKRKTEYQCNNCKQKYVKIIKDWNIKFFALRGKDMELMAEYNTKPDYIQD